MKKFIGLALAAIVVLSGCKSNSFKTQRYTKFGHASVSKKSYEGHLTEKVEKEPEFSAKETNIEKNTESENAVYCINSNKVDESLLKESFPRLTINKANTPAEVSSENIIKVEGDHLDIKKTELKSKKSLKEKVESAQRVIGKVLKIVLFAIILAIVVGVIIIILIT